MKKKPNARNMGRISDGKKLQRHNHQKGNAGSIQRGRGMYQRKGYVEVFQVVA